jgi:hypothetical protein
VSHAAPGLEALLPARVAGHRLQRGSAIGTAVLSGGDAFSRVFKRILAGVGARPGDLRWANARDPTGALELEIGVFQVRGMAASALRDAIVTSTRPNAPGLAVSRVDLGGKRVEKLVYPGGSVLYLYAHAPVVYYVGTQDNAVAGRVLGRLP